MSRCAVQGCQVDVPQHQVICSEHWLIVPKPLRDRYRAAERTARMPRARDADKQALDATRREVLNVVSGLEGVQ